ncbi:hydroxymethylglutaryl-CoA reductase, degradative [Streptococcus thoraltensis]|uniref:hydroxymethylglutaryl-CoA reductase, degradative n=1 Tax=Streptococcus thoraltensis TaxID=55085 RepID=UPI0003657D22|nr:hydroxymethylglutaryl-CoA reductase, degradative [Streptococcus thoraltensis]MDY4762423.1 hydroxymethylglutaryl-CoA reductase, degradative [Streptococcus thoraltensis]
MTNLKWTGFAKKSPQERIDLIREFGLLEEESQDILQKQIGLPLEIANQMAENVVSELSLPFAIAPDFLVNDKFYQLPMVTEEPSVVAAASFAAKIIKRSGGFTTTVHNRQMIGQVALFDVPNFEKATANILEQKAFLLNLADQAYPSIVKRGGGARNLWLEQKENFLITYVSVDTQEAMGANMVNTMMEALVPSLEELSQGQSLMAILSNYATESLVSAECEVGISSLSRNKDEANRLAQKFVMASQLAQVDPYRASTHNKGIFNGIDALVIATGNDWRAIEAGAHAYASRDGQYRGFSYWSYDEEAATIKGHMTLPMPIATRGGSIGLNPTVQIAYDLLDNPDAKELAGLIVSLGLAQNFAALKALTSTGIQAGHMKLHAKSLALLAGAKDNEVGPLVQELLKEKHMNLATSEELLSKMRQESMN